MIVSHKSLPSPDPPDLMGIVSWVHFGDLHMTTRAQPELRPGLDGDRVAGAWPERGILGTQLGPNKNGRR